MVLDDVSHFSQLNEPTDEELTAERDLSEGAFKENGPEFTAKYLLFREMRRVGKVTMNHDSSRREFDHLFAGSCEKKVLTDAWMNGVVWASRKFSEFPGGVSGVAAVPAPARKGSYVRDGWANDDRARRFGDVTEVYRPRVVLDIPRRSVEDILDMVFHTIPRDGRDLKGRFVKKDLNAEDPVKEASRQIAIALGLSLKM